MFDPAQPATKSKLSSAVMRSQLTSLKALIDAIASITDAEIDGVTTLAPGLPATVSVNVTGNTMSFTFGIPRGADGAEGPPGEVTAAALDAAISTTAVNPSAVSPLSMLADSSYSQPQMQEVANKVDELLAAIKRL